MSIKLLVTLHPGFINTPSVERAISLANVMDVEIMLYSVVYDEYIPNLYFDTDQIEKMRQSILESERIKLEKIKSRLVSVAKSVETLSQWNYSVTDGISEAVKQFNADLMIVSSTRHTTMSRLFMTNTDWEILRCASIPVLFAHDNNNKPYSKVMVAVDPTHEHDKPAELDHSMISIGKLISDSFAGELHIAHAYPSIRTELTMDYIPPIDQTERWKQRNENAVYQLASNHNIEKEKIHFLDEHPRLAIPDLARDIKADLVVIGIVSRNLINQLIIGSTAEYVIDHFECDVLTVPAKQQN
jgi:universal stress protein E